MIYLWRLSGDGIGVKNIELANAMNVTKPSVHNMLKSLCQIGIVKQENFGLAHLTEEGSVISKKLEACYNLFKEKMIELCGGGVATEIAICGILAEMSTEKIDQMYFDFITKMQK